MAVSVPLRGIGSEKRIADVYIYDANHVYVSVPLRGIGSEKQSRVIVWNLLFP